MRKCSFLLTLVDLQFVSELTEEWRRPGHNTLHSVLIVQTQLQVSDSHIDKKT